MSSEKVVTLEQSPTTAELTPADKLRALAERQMAEEEQANAKYQRRLFYLLPFNILMIYGTIKYSKNVNAITKYFWPHRRKVSIKNLFIVGSCQALFFSTVFIFGNMLLLGLNPREVYQRHMRHKQEELELMANSPIDES